MNMNTTNNYVRTGKAYYTFNTWEQLSKFKDATNGDLVALDESGNLKEIVNYPVIDVDQEKQRLYEGIIESAKEKDDEQIGFYLNHLYDLGWYTKKENEFFVDRHIMFQDRYALINKDNLTIKLNHDDYKLAVRASVNKAAEYL